MLSTDGPTGMWVADAQELAAKDFDPSVDGLISECAGQLPDVVVVEHVLLISQRLFAAGGLAGLAPAIESIGPGGDGAASARWARSKP